MPRALRALRALPLLLLLNLTGCQFESVLMELPGFFSTGVDEIWFWRRDEGSNTYVRAGHIRLVGMSGPAGDQRLVYTQYNPQGEPGLTLDSQFESSGDTLRVDFWFANWLEDGTFKVSARNQAGESSLSVGTVSF